MKFLLRPVVLAFVCLLVVACGGSQSPDLSTLPTPTGNLETTDDGWVVVEGAGPDMAYFPYFELIPPNWPEQAGSPPVVGVGTIEVVGARTYAVPFAMRQSANVSDLIVRGTATLSELGDSKLLVTITDVSRDTVVLSGGADMGIVEGDVYFVLNHDPDEPRRVASRFGAILRVQEVLESGSVARVVHANDTVEAGDVARFAQMDLRVASSPVSILLGQASEGATEAFPAYADALPDLLAEYELSNVSIEGFSRFLDPTLDDAARLATDAVSHDGYGVLALVQSSINGVIYNVSAFGDAPTQAHVVGILPGGLAITDDAEVFIATSVLATALALRGEHAMAAYVVETELRDLPPLADAAYHLREHLALRFSALDWTVESLSTMNIDVDRARARGQAIPLLNALSIRAYLDLDIGLGTLHLADTQEFLAVATGVLPESSLGGERLAVARALRFSGDMEGAESLLFEVAQSATANSDTELGYSVAIERAMLSLSQGQPAAALIAMQDAADLLPNRADSVAYHYSLAAQIYLMIAENPELTGVVMERDDLARGLFSSVRSSLEAALDTAPNVRADILFDLAEVHEATGDFETVIEFLYESARLFMETNQYASAVTALTSLTMLEIQVAREHGGYQAMELLVQAYQAVDVAAQLAYHAGSTLEASRALLLQGLLAFQFEEYDASDVALEIAADLARQSAHYPTLSEIYAVMARVAERRRDFDLAAEYRQTSDMWNLAAQQ